MTSGQLLAAGFNPEAAGAARHPEKLMGALYVVWDEACLPPLPAHISPWEVAEDAARKSRQVERSRAEALAQARKVPAVQGSGCMLCWCFSVQVCCCSRQAFKAGCFTLPVNRKPR